MVNVEHVTQKDINRRLVSVDLWMCVSPVILVSASYFMHKIN